MARCTNCNHKWKAKDIWKLGISKNGKECPTCKTQQYVSFQNGGLLMGLGYLSGVVGLLLIIFFPFYIKLSDTNEAPLG